MSAPAPIAPFTAFAHELAAAARAEILPFFRAEHAVENKAAADFDPVTQADKAAETKLRAMITARFPDHGVLGEEFGHRPAQSRYTWIIDPIDGTRQFIAGLPLWGVLIALIEDETPILGLIDQPYLQERFIGWRTGAILQTKDAVRPLRAGAVPKVAQAHIATTDPGLFTGAEARAFASLSSAARMRRFGCDCYAYAMLALGGLDIVVESGLAPWDIAALAPVLEGAGASLTDWRGQAPFARSSLLDPKSRFQALAAANSALAIDAAALLGPVLDFDAEPAR